MLLKVLMYTKDIAFCNVWLYSRTDLSNSESEEPRPKACEPRYGGAEPGDRTMIDALNPVLDSLLLDEIIIIWMVGK